MKRLYILAIFVAGVLCGCSRHDPAPPETNDGAITLIAFLDEEDILSRSLLYDDEIDLRADLFHTYSYITGSNTSCFNSDVKYSEDDVDPTKHRWLFYGTGGYRNYYWPLATSLDFFAYAPVSNGYVDVDNSVNPPTFTATMPLTNTADGVNQENLKEFMYAYTPGRVAAQGAVPLAFQHPFAAVVFEVKQSQRDLTVNEITMCDVKYKGTFTPYGDAKGWSVASDEGDLMLSVGKKIPADVNFGGQLCGPYIVLPQVNTSDEKVFSIKCHWKGYDTTSDDVDKDTKILTGKITNDWEPGHIYTYSLDLGNSREEILFQVKVTPWKYVYEHEFEIE